MRPLVDLDAYAVEIRVQLPDGRTWRRGSGYVIYPCRILTALHVIVGDDVVLKGGSIAAPNLIEVRALGDFLEHFGERDVVLARYLERIHAKARDGDYLWRRAELRWPKPGAAMPQYDLAILEVPPELAVKLKRLSTAPRIACIKPTADVACRAMGFPQWTVEEVDGTDISSPRPVTGTLSFGPATQRTFHPFTATNGGPVNSNEWKRISGSAFLLENSLVGVASAVLDTSGNNGLWLTQLSDLADVNGFEQFWAAAGLARPRSQRAGGAGPLCLIDPLPYLHQFDRTIPGDRVFDVLDNGTSTDPQAIRPAPIFRTKWSSESSRSSLRSSSALALDVSGCWNGDMPARIMIQNRPWRSFYAK